MRIVSLVPAATEIVYALGLADQLVGRSHDCDYPTDVLDLPAVTHTPAPQEGADGYDIHAGSHAAREVGAVTVRLDADALRRLQPDLVLTGEFCDACAVGRHEVDEAVRGVADDVTVVSLEPHSIEGIFNTISTVGAFAEAEDEAIGLVELLRERLGALENRILDRRLQGIASRRAVVLEWLEPLFACGHWIPEMVRRAGGWELLGREGERSTQTTWDRLREVDPEIIVLALCGLDAAGSALSFEAARLPAWFDDLDAVREGQLFAVDGAGLLSRPGPRVVEGVAVLAELFDPEAFAGAGPSEAWVPLSPVGIGRGRGG